MVQGHGLSAIPLPPRLTFYHLAFYSLRVNIPNAAQVVSLLSSEPFTAPHSLQDEVQIPQPGIQGSSSNLPF